MKKRRRVFKDRKDLTQSERRARLAEGARWEVKVQTNGQQGI